MLMLIQT